MITAFIIGKHVEKSHLKGQSCVQEMIPHLLTTGVNVHLKGFLNFSATEIITLIITVISDCMDMGRLFY